MPISVKNNDASKNMKRILHVVGAMDRAGAETMIMNLYRVIDRKQFQFDFLYFTDKKCDYDDEILKLGGKIYRVLGKNSFVRMKKTIKLLKVNSQWETVHAHMLFNNAFHMYAAYKAGVKQRISHSHSTCNKPKNSITDKLYYSLSRKIQHHYSTHFVACGEAAANFLFSEVNDVILLPNSIDIEGFAEVASKNKNYLKEEFSLNDNTIILLQIGRLSPVKNHTFSFRIIKELKNHIEDFKFFIVGQGPLKENLEEEVKRLRIDDVVEFLGVRSDIPQLLASADLMLMPSLHEGFPVVLVESQAAGTPALIADTISSEVDLGVKLVYFESLGNKPKIWVEQIEKIVDRNQISVDERVQTLKKQGFDIHTNVKVLEKLYVD